MTEGKMTFSFFIVKKFIFLTNLARKKREMNKVYIFI